MASGSEAVTASRGLRMDNIRKACLLISYSNGGVHRGRSETKVLRDLQHFIDSRPYADEMKSINAWLGTLSEQQLETVCDGDQDEAEAITRSAPPFTEALLNEWFEEA